MYSSVEVRKGSLFNAMVEGGTSEFDPESEVPRNGHRVDVILARTDALTMGEVVRRSNQLVKRKTPSELRLEQLERGRKTEADKGETSRQFGHSKNVEVGKCARLIDTRVADVYAATKPGDRPGKMLLFKDMLKVGTIGQLKSQDQACNSTETHGSQLSSKGDVVSISRPRYGNFSYPQAQVVSGCTFKTVTELSSGSASLETGFQAIADQNKTFPLAGKNHQVLNKSTANGYPLQMTQPHVPLDLSLKNSARLVSTNSLHWCHQISTSSQCQGLGYYMERMKESDSTSMRSEYRNFSPLECDKVAIGAYFWESLHSWVHPQTTFPPRAAFPSAHSEQVFYAQRKQMWEVAIQSLYFMFRKRVCSIFYVCCQQFVVMFVGGLVGGRHKEACSAFLTRSTPGLRGLLHAQDIQFTMPLSEVGKDLVVEEKLLDINDFEKASIAALDNSVSSILAFDGPKNVHRLYDFLLNQRFLLSSSASADVPILLSPVPFEHGTLTKPQLVCKQMQLPDMSGKQDAQTSPGVIDLEITYTVDLKGMLMPYWVVGRVCNVLQGSQPTGFDISFSTDPLSEGLNVAQSASSGMNPGGSELFSRAPGSHSHGLGKASVKHLKYRDKLYTVNSAVPV